MLLTRELFNPVSACMLCTAAWLRQPCAANLTQLIRQAAYQPQLLLWLLSNTPKLAILQTRNWLSFKRVPKEIGVTLGKCLFVLLLFIL